MTPAVPPQRGAKSGWPIGRPKAVFDHERVVALRDGGLSLRDIARATGLGVGTVRRTLQQSPEPSEVCQNPVAVCAAGDASVAAITGPVDAGLPNSLKEASRLAVNLDESKNLSTVDRDSTARFDNSNTFREPFLSRLIHDSIAGRST
jgi:hypothetical protein